VAIFSICPPSPGLEIKLRFASWLLDCQRCRVPSFWPNMSARITANGKRQGFSSINSRNATEARKLAAWGNRQATGDSHNGDSDKLNGNLNLPLSDTNRQHTHLQYTLYRYNVLSTDGIVKVTNKLPEPMKHIEPKAKPKPRPNRK